MNQGLLDAIVSICAAFALCSLLAVFAWVQARQKEREAFYRSEAIKKIAEMPAGAPPELVGLLRDAVASREPSPWIPPGHRIREREAFYRAETIKKVAEAQGANLETVAALLREQEQGNQQRFRENTKLAGLIIAAVGVALLISLRGIIPERPVYLSGLVPLLIGAAMLLHAFTLRSKA